MRKNRHKQVTLSDFRVFVRVRGIDFPVFSGRRVSFFAFGLIERPIMVVNVGGCSFCHVSKIDFGAV
jgi:hypothetical protein